MDEREKAALRNLTVLFGLTVLYNFIVYTLGVTGNFPTEFYLGVPVRREGNNEIILRSTAPVYLLMGIQGIFAAIAYVMVPWTLCYSDDCYDTRRTCTPWGLATRYLSQLSMGFSSGLTAVCYLIVSGEMSFLILVFSLIAQMYIVVIGTRFMDNRLPKKPSNEQAAIHLLLTTALLFATAGSMLWNLILNANECQIGTVSWWFASAFLLNSFPYFFRTRMYTYLWGMFVHLVVSNIVLVSLVLSQDCYYRIVNV